MLSRLVFRITAPLIAVGLLLLSVGIFAAWYVHQLQQETANLLADSVASTEAAQAFEDKVIEMDEHLRLYAQTGNRQYLMSAAGLHDEANRWLIQTERLVYSPETRTLVKQIRRQYAIVIDDIERWRRTGAGGPVTEQAALQASRPAALLAIAREQRALNERRLAEATKRSQEDAKRVGRGLLTLGICGAIAGVLAGIGIAMGVQRSIVELSVPIRSAAGALDEVIGPIRVVGGGSIESVQRELDVLAGRVAEVVERLQQSQWESLRSEQLAAVGQLAAGLAHELRNPLTAMQTLVQTARQQPEGEGLDERDLQVLEEEIVRLNASIQAFLDFARPPKLQRQPTDVVQLIEKTVQLVTAQADRQGVEIETENGDSIPQLDADPDQLRQVILNLLLNAIDAQPTGGEIQIAVKRVAQNAMPESGADGLPSRPNDTVRASESECVVLSIADSGPGIPEENRQRVFEPFFSTKETGSGLGLSTCRRIIEDHGGAIQVDEAAAGGTLFEIRLPI